jgi:hypothetical protein
VGKGRWKAKCPSHRDRSPSLSIVAGEDRTHITCFAGCHSDDVLATLGLTWKATLYRDSTFSPEERRQWGRQQRIDKLYQREQCMQDMKWLLSVVENPPTTRTEDTFKTDIDAFCERLSR